MKKTGNNYAFIDSQNLNLGIQKLGWKLDYKKFRVYLKEKYNVQKAYMFISFVSLNQKLYDKAIIVSSDGDFYSLAEYLNSKNKLEVVLSPDIENCSGLLKQVAKGRMHFMNKLQDKLEYKKKSTA